jgi:hypothetical protein
MAFPAGGPSAHDAVEFNVVIRDNKVVLEAKPR